MRGAGSLPIPGLPCGPQRSFGVSTYKQRAWHLMVWRRSCSPGSSISWWPAAKEASSQGSLEPPGCSFSSPEPSPVQAVSIPGWHPPFCLPHKDPSERGKFPALSKRHPQVWTLMGGCSLPPICLSATEGRAHHLHKFNSTMSGWGSFLKNWKEPITIIRPTWESLSWWWKRCLLSGLLHGRSLVKKGVCGGGGVGGPCEADQVQPRGSLWRKEPETNDSSLNSIYTGDCLSIHIRIRGLAPGTDRVFSQGVNNVAAELSCPIHWSQASNQDGVSYFENSCHLCVPPPFHSAGPCQWLKWQPMDGEANQIVYYRPKSICIDCRNITVTPPKSHTNNSLAGDVIQPRFLWLELHLNLGERKQLYWGGGTGREGVGARLCTGKRVYTTRYNCIRY